MNYISYIEIITEIGTRREVKYNVFLEFFNSLT